VTISKTSKRSFFCENGKSSISREIDEIFQIGFF